MRKQLVPAVVEVPLWPYRWGRLYISLRNHLSWKETVAACQALKKIARKQMNQQEHTGRAATGNTAECASQFLPKRAATGRRSPSLRLIRKSPAGFMIGGG